MQDTSPKDHRLREGEAALVVQPSHAGLMGGRGEGGGSPWGPPVLLRAGGEVWPREARTRHAGPSRTGGRGLCMCLLSCYGTLDVFNKAPSWLEQAVCAHVALTPSLSSPARHGSHPLPLPHDLVRLSQGPSTQTPVGVSCPPQPLDSSAPPASHLRHPLVRASCQLTGSHSRPPAPSVPV